MKLTTRVLLVGSLGAMLTGAIVTAASAAAARIPVTGYAVAISVDYQPGVHPRDTVELGPGATWQGNVELNPYEQFKFWIVRPDGRLMPRSVDCAYGDDREAYVRAVVLENGLVFVRCSEPH
jgi:hypothetical protein